MTTTEVGQLLSGFALLLLAANVLGTICTKLRQPRVVGEILAGVLFGPSILGDLAPGFTRDVLGVGAEATDVRQAGVGLIYNLGLLLLMFTSGAAVRNVLGKENGKQTAWILSIGTPLPFVLTLLVAPHLPLDSFIGEAGSRSAVVLVFCSAVAVTSIPVITKIFHDLGILHTRFASLMLGSAVLEDIMLWGVVSVATAIAGSALGGSADVTGTVASHILVNAAFVMMALVVMPRVLRAIGRARWNVIAVESPVTWAMLVFLGYVSIASLLDVTFAFAAFLAGFGLMGGVHGTERARFRAPVQSIAAVSQGLFVPLYFAIVGLKLDFGKGFSLPMLLAFLVGSSLLATACGLLAGRLAGFGRLGAFNIAITSNARGGPGILLASVAFEAGIISSAFFTTLVITAVVTSQICGVWLDVVVRRGWSLLGETPEAEAEWAAATHEAVGHSLADDPVSAVQAGSVHGDRPVPAL